MCTATLQLITFDFLAFPKTFSWSGPSVSGASTPTNPTGAISQSSLQQTYTTAGSYNYSCTVSVSVPGDPTASTTDAISVIVTGKCVYIHMYMYACIYSNGKSTELNREGRYM